MSDRFRAAEEKFRQGLDAQLMEEAAAVSRRVFGGKVFLRGLIEYSNHCGCNCLYCGIRRDNPGVERYRLSDEAVYAAVDSGFGRGLRTFVLQGGEDPAFDVSRLCGLVKGIKERTRGEAALTLSCGILPREAYAELKAAGADRYLIRFETSDPELHKYLRGGVTLERRLQALYDLKSLGFQTGSGFMVGLPGETEDTVVNNVRLAEEIGLDMVGIGPFIPHPETPLKDSPQVALGLALRTTAFLRVVCPQAHIPATTAAGSLEPDGREQMIRRGANVVMPNLTPVEAKKNYLLYPGKICLDEDGLQCIGCLGMRIKSTGFEMSFDRADGLVCVQEPVR